LRAFQSASEEGRDLRRKRKTKTMPKSSSPSTMSGSRPAALIFPSETRKSQSLREFGLGVSPTLVMTAAAVLASALMRHMPRANTLIIAYERKKSFMYTKYKATPSPSLSMFSGAVESRG
jgi:hypothetical protein